MASELLFLVYVKLLIVGLGSAIVILSYNAHRRMHSTFMLFISAGFGLVTLGSVLEGVFFEFLGYSLLEARIMESTIVLAGLLTLIYSVNRAST